MKFLNTVIHKKKHLNNYKTVEILFFSTLCVFLPVFLTHPQWALGVIINAILFRTAMAQKGWKYTLPVIILPSIGAISSGLIFGAPIMMLFIFAPIIWIGNLIYILLNKYFIIHKNINSILSISVSSFIKFLILFTSALITVNFFNFPEILLITMGGIQIITAIFGGLFVFFLQSVYSFFKTKI